MIERQEGRVESISIIKHLQDHLDLCTMVIGFDEIKIFYDANELMQFVGKDVEYTTRPDVVDGEPCLVICELALLSAIHTVESVDNIKLVPEGSKRTMCNVRVKTLRFGEFYANCIALMSKYQLGSSPKAKWFDCTMIDQESKEFVVRLFASNVETSNMDDILSSFLGKYVAFDMESTKYGLQTKEIIALPEMVEESPEVVVAREVIKNIIANDNGLRDYNYKYQYLDTMSSLIDGEPGYGLVRIASEIYMINAIDNISCDLDINAMKRAAICSRGYLLPHKTSWSRPMLNTNRAMGIPQLKEDRELMLMLDVLAEEDYSDTKQTYIKIKGMVNDIIEIRRGVHNEDEKDSFGIATITNALNGLL